MDGITSPHEINALDVTDDSDKADDSRSVVLDHGLVRCFRGDPALRPVVVVPAYILDAVEKDAEAFARIIAEHSDR